MTNIDLFGRRCGSGSPTLVIAEMSGNHNGSLDRALSLVRAAKSAGADVVKLQTYTADTMTMDSDGPWFTIRGGPWDGRRLHDLYREASTPWEWHPQLVEEARRVGIEWFSTPFDDTAVDYLESIGCPVYKIASFEVTDLPLLRRIAATGKPVVMSVGMATLAEIDQAVRTLRTNGCPRLALLHCISAYPAPAAEMRLANIGTLARAFDCVVGLSDHTLSNSATVAAVALGARLVEKHMCLRRADGGPDAGFSLEGAEFEALVAAIRETEAATSGTTRFGPEGAERANLRFRRSLFSARDIPAGGVVSEADLRIIRPGDGLPPSALPQVLGRRARSPIARATPLSWDLLE